VKQLGPEFRCTECGFKDAEVDARGALGLSDDLLDQLIGAGDQRRRQIDPHRARRLQIDDEFKPGWLLDGEVGGPRALEDAVDVAGSPLRCFGRSGCIR
jgi:hypothetical protein